MNPIIDWTTDEVWEFIHKYNVPYCKLYDEGFKRLGCVGCPMGTTKNRLREFERWPTYRQAYVHAFDRMIQERNRGGTQTPSNQDESLPQSMSEGPSENTTTGNPKDLIPVDVTIVGKQFVFAPKWGQWDEGSTGEDVMTWWIR